MSAALQLPDLAASAGEQALWQEPSRPEHATPGLEWPQAAEPEQPGPVRSLAFYRKHTEKILLRYLYASLLVGRAPAMLSEPLTRGWVSNRRVKTFEDSVIFVLDMEKCLARLTALERMLLSRVVLQDYSLAETALLLRLSMRTVSRLHWDALDRLTRLLLDEGMLVVPKS